MNREEIEKWVAQAKDLEKAVTAGTYPDVNPPARSIYSPDNLDPVIKHVVPMATPVRALLPREKGYGEYASWRKLVSRIDPQAGGTGVRGGFADAGTPNETEQDYTYETAPYKNIGRDVKIGKQQISSNRNSNLEDVRAHEEMIKATEVLLLEEDIILNGDVSTNALEFDGFSKKFVTNSGSAALVTASGVGNYTRTLYDKGVEAPEYLVANAFQMQALGNQLEGSGSIQRIVAQSGTDQAGMVGGQKLVGIVNPVGAGNIIKTVTSRYCGAWAYLLTVHGVDGTEYLKMSDLEGMSVYDVPTSVHAVQSRVYESTVLAVIAEQFQYKIGGLATSA